MDDSMKILIAFLVGCAAVITASYLKYDLFGACIAVFACAVVYMILAIISCYDSGPSHHDIYD